MPVIDLGRVVGPRGADGASIIGPQGPRGEAGPNQVSTTTATSLNGLLIGNGTNVNVKSITDTISQNSAAIPTSSAVYSSTRERLSKIGMGENLLRNWYFRGGGARKGKLPVNQRRFTRQGGANNDAGQGGEWCIDGWKTRSTTGIVTLTSNGINIQSSVVSGSDNRHGILQYLNLNKFEGKPLELSVLTTGGFYRNYLNNLQLSDSSTAKLTVDITEVVGGDTTKIGEALLLAKTELYPGDTLPENYSGPGTMVMIRMLPGYSATIVAVKLEVGSEQTLAHDEGSNGVENWKVNTIPDYTEELEKCQLFGDLAQIPATTDALADLDMASSQQTTANVQIGNIATKNYAVGELLVMYGKLYQVISAVSRGYALTPGTNCSETTLEQQVHNYGLGIMGNAIPSDNRVTDCKSEAQIPATGWYDVASTASNRPSGASSNAAMIYAVVRGDLFRYLEFYDFAGKKVSSCMKFANNSWTDWVLHRSYS